MTPGFAEAIESFYLIAPVHYPPFWVNGKEYSITKWSDGYVWCEAASVIFSTDLDLPPFETAAQAQQNAMEYACTQEAA